MKAKVLITGSSGFIGKILTKKLSKQYKVFSIDKTKKGRVDNFYHIDLRNKKKLNEFFSKNKVDTIIHLASEIFDENENIVYENNIICAQNLIDLAKKYKIKQIIFTSTFSIYEKNYNNLIKESENPQQKINMGFLNLTLKRTSIYYTI